MSSMIKKALSYQSIKNMKFDTELTDISENIGLRVRRGKTGKTTFYYRYRDPYDSKKLIQMIIGYFPQMDLSVARMKLHELKKIRELGRCPKTENEHKKQHEIELNRRQQQTTAFTVKAMIDLYLTQYIEDRHSANGQIIKGARKIKGQDEVRRTLYSDVIRVLGDKAAIDVKRQDIIDLIMSIVDRGANVQAGNTLRELSASYEFSLGLGYITSDFTNPAILAKSSLRMTKVKLTSQKGKRVLSELELKQFLTWLPTSKLPEKAKQIFMLTLYTGCRTGEWCNANWSDIDFEKKTLHIKLTKTETERYVQLSSYAINLLKVVKIDCKTGSLFISPYTCKPLSQKKLTEYTWSLRHDNVMLDIPHWTPHDLRRTVRTGLSRLQCPSEVAEAILGHSRKGIEGTYDLHRYESECREWLQKWGDNLNELSNNGAIN